MQVEKKEETSDLKRERDPSRRIGERDGKGLSGREGQIAILVAPKRTRKTQQQREGKEKIGDFDETYF